MMLRYAIYVVFDIERKEGDFKNILFNEKHRRYLNVSIFEKFLTILRDTVRDLLEDEWDENIMLQPWNDKIQKTLAIVKEEGAFSTKD